LRAPIKGEHRLQQNQLVMMKGSYYLAFGIFELVSIVKTKEGVYLQDTGEESS
jgi:hypothetical protein